MPPQKYILLFADVFVVEGAINALMISYGRKKMHDISLSAAYLIKQFPLKTIEELRMEFAELGEMLPKFFDFLIENQLAFYADDPERFSEVDPTYRSAGMLDNAIIEIDKSLSPAKLKELLYQLGQLGTEYLELRLYEPMKRARLETYLATLAQTSIIGVDLILAYQPELTEKALAQLTLDYQRLAAVYVHSSPEDKYVAEVEHKLFNDMGMIYYLQQTIDSHACCGLVSKASLSIGVLQTFLHNRQANSCLNKKIAIDLAGNIKNCPSLPEVFGNIATDSLYEVVRTQHVSRYWDITKDEIEVCKDCKYRYICTDCRAFRTDPDNPYSKPAKCGYDPYTDQWHESAQKSWGISRYQQS